ncbi:tensin-3 [Thalassophryne amazonica]|uniref:tensin-3 n=1 Tax=Thalassophryne amazonica TaxID=390379 RepID=UPI001471FDFE|nr:tensin-3 [Thalassophryne amazonica]
MEERRGIDLTYIGERIINIFCLHECPQQMYLQDLQEVLLMLQSKHGHNCMLINLSEKSNALTQMKPKVLDMGWVDLLAPDLDQIFSVCTAMEKWLQTHPKHVVVLHCRGGKSRTGVLVASYIHFTSTSDSAELSLDRFAMRRFYTDHLSAVMTPSQRRYVWMLGSMLMGDLQMCSSPCFLLCVVLHGLPQIQPGGGCSLFLRVYQSLQAVCTSPVYHVTAAQTERLYFVLQPAQLLKGDIMVACYDKNSRSASRQLIFRLQFHTGVTHGHALTFLKAELDCANEDCRFPEDGKVELMLSDGPENFKGRTLWQNPLSVTVDYDTLDPVVRRDSYQATLTPKSAPDHLQNPGNDALYSKVRKECSGERALFHLSTQVPSANSDSGLLVTSQGCAGGSVTIKPRREVKQDNCPQARKLVCGLAPEPAQPPLEGMTELPVSRRGEVEATRDEPVFGCINGKAFSTERETDILDDEEIDDLNVAASALQMSNSRRLWSLSSENPPEGRETTLKEYSTHSWVRQQQMADVLTHSYPTADREEHSNPMKPPPLVAPDTPPRGLSSKEAVQKVLINKDGVHSVRQNRDMTQDTHGAPCQDEELASLATDIDESIEQLNQLILDLDPAFIPVPTCWSPASHLVSLNANGLNHKGKVQLSGWELRDVTDGSGLYSPGWRGGGAQTFRSATVSGSNLLLSQLGELYKSNSTDVQGTAMDIVPPTPAFPVSPPTPYVKTFSEASQSRSSGQWQAPDWTQDSRGYLDGMNHTGGSTEGELFRSDTPTSFRKVFGSMCSVSSGSPRPHTDSSTPPPPVWLDRTSNSSSPPLSLSTPNAHSSPRGPLKGLGGLGVNSETENTNLSSLLGNGGLEHSLLEVMEDLGRLSLGSGDGILPPLLPEKRRAAEGRELGSRSPSFSGFSSPHSGSSLSIPLSPAVNSDPHRMHSGASSPGAESGGKQDTVKFVQDTSKFWYKPDISREQAIGVLKDKEPGAFIVRDSHSFRGAYGLAMKVATPPPSVLQHSKKNGDMSKELVRHFLIECTQKGVRLKGCPNEPYFGSLTALVCQHSITPLALPCKLILPDRDPMEDLNNSPVQTAANSAAELLKQGAACNVWYLGSVELESLTGVQAVQKATTQTLAMDPPPAFTVVHFKVSAQGITLTDNQRKLFFRRHYTVSSVIFCSLDPQGRKWTRDSGSTAKIFGFVARKSQSETENVCHLFAEHDPEQPASAIVNFVSKVMIGSHKK